MDCCLVYGVQCPFWTTELHSIRSRNRNRVGIRNGIYYYYYYYYSYS